MTLEKLNSHFRAHPLPSPGIPIGARSVGDYRPTQGWKDNVFAKPFFQVLWGVTGEGSVIVDGEKSRLRPGLIAVYHPGMVHRIEAPEAGWRYRWWTLDGPDAAAVFATLGLRSGVHPAGVVPEARFRKLETLIAGTTFAEELAASAEAYALLCEAASGLAGTEARPSLPPQVARAIELCRRYWSDPDCNVAFLAARLGMHRSSLSRAFAEAVGRGPAEFLATMRADNARSLLVETDVSVAEVARRCGFHDTTYFVRRFRLDSGMTPGAYRAAARPEKGVR